MAHADARSAGGFDDAGAGSDNVSQSAVLRDHFEHLFGTGRDGHGNTGVDVFALEHLGDHHQVGVRAVGAGAHADLLHINGLKLRDLDDIVRAVGLGNERLKFVQVDDELFIVGRAGVGSQRRPVLAAALSLHVGTGVLVGREEGGRRAQFRAHVRDGRAGGGREALHAGAVYSKILPTPPFTVSLRKTSKMMSFAVTQGCSLPFSSTRKTFGMVM